jgi:hypothetical protein
MSTTTIRIDTETRDRLRAKGRMGESYDDVIRGLLEVVEANAARNPEHARRPTPTLSAPLFPHQDRR